MLNQIRRMMHSVQEERKTLESKLEIAGKERERQTAIAQNLQSQCLDMQLSLQKVQVDRDDLRRALDEVDTERADMLVKFDQFGSILSE